MSINLLHYLPDSGGTVERYLKDSLTVTIVNSDPEVSVSWIQDGSSVLDGNPQGVGYRIYPEEKIIESEGQRSLELQNRIQVIFQLNTNTASDTTLYYRVLDPDNYISLGKDAENEFEIAFLGNDNNGGPLKKVAENSTPCSSVYCSSVLSIQVPAGNHPFATVTLEIEEAYAGDNFIVIADTDYNKVANTTLGNQRSTRYMVTPVVANYCVAQTPPLTVWRTLNMELGQMQAPVIPTVDDPAYQGFNLEQRYNNGSYTGPGSWDVTVPETNSNSGTISSGEPYDFDLLTQPALPDVSLLSDEMETACISINVLSDDEIKFLSGHSVLELAPFNHYLFYDNQTETGRDTSIASNTPTFWLIYALGAYEPAMNMDFDGENDCEIGYASPTILWVYNETLRDCLSTAIPLNPICTYVSCDEGTRRIMLHETLHYFLGEHATKTNSVGNKVLDFDDITNVGIMNKNGNDPNCYLYVSGSCNITPEQIRAIQSKLVNSQR